MERFVLSETDPSLTAWKNGLQDELSTTLKCTGLRFTSAVLLKNDVGYVYHVTGRKPLLEGDKIWSKAKQNIQSTWNDAPDGFQDRHLQVEYGTGELRCLGHWPFGLGHKAHESEPSESRRAPVGSRLINFSYEDSSKKKKRAVPEPIGQFVSFDVRTLELGNSLSVTGDNGAGTMGGYLTVGLSGSKSDHRVYGLTNNHVMNVHSRGTQHEDPGHVMPVAMRIPAWEDYKVTYEGLKAGNAQQKEQAAQFRKRYNRDAGKLKYASGRRVVRGETGYHLMDWALVDLENWVIDDFLEHYKRSKRNAFSRAEDTPLGRDGVRGIGALEDGMQVSKFGRTTGHTRGTVAAGQDAIELDDILPDKGKGLPFFVPQGCTRVNEYYVMNKNGAFLQPGDSGSWVLDQHGRLVGLAWGELAAQDRAYITPIGVVLDDIRRAVYEGEGKLRRLTEDLEDRLRQSLQSQGRENELERHLEAELKRELRKRVEVNVFT